MEHTQNYQLNQYEPGDPFLRENFNADNAKIDTALGAKCEVVFGTYHGDGRESRTIPLPCSPRAILVECATGERPNSYNCAHGGLALRGAPCTRGLTLDGDKLTVRGDGIDVANPLAHYGTNANNHDYYYLAVL